MSLRRTELRAFSAKRMAELEAQGIRPTSTFKPTQRKATGKRPKDTGPKQSVTELVHKRSGGMCEWSGCTEPATDKHHRLNRKDGGRHGEMRDRLNGVAWLLHACRVHHAYVTSPFGHRLLTEPTFTEGDPEQRVRARLAPTSVPS
jgi:hypothetical protein